MEIRRRILVVDDDALLAELLLENLNASGFEARAAHDAIGARSAVREFDPDAVILDIDLGGGANGVDLAHILLVTAPYLGIVFLSRLTDARFVGAEIPSGTAVAYLQKQAVRDPHEITRAVEAVLAENVAASHRHDQRPNRPLGTLSSAQFETLRLVAEGRTNDEIARARGTSVRAVEHLVRRTFAAAGIDEEPGGSRRVRAARTFLAASGRG